MEDFNSQAHNLISRGDLEGAAKLLEAALSHIPEHWRPSQQLPDHREVTCWDLEEFVALVEWSVEHGDKERIVWTIPSYSQGFYLLAVIAMEQGRLDASLKALDDGLRLEGDHPHLLSEKAVALNRMGRYEESLALYRKAATSRPWVTPRERARALRGQAVTLVDLGKIDDAEKLLQESLVLEPDSEAAKQELSYIEMRRAGQSAGIDMRTSKSLAFNNRGISHRTTGTNQGQSAREVYQDSSRGFLFRNGGYLVVASFVVGLFINGLSAVSYVLAGHILMGLWALAGIVILPKSVLGFVLLLGRGSGVSANLPLGFYSLFPRTLRKYQGSDWPPLESRLLRLFIGEFLWAAMALFPFAVLVLFRGS